MDALIEYLTDNAAPLAALLVGIHVVALAVVNLTPTPADNQALAKLYAIVEKLAGILTQAAKDRGEDLK
jgi:hypothetical protein